MRRWSLRYHFLQGHELETELLERCLQLRRSRRKSDVPSGSIGGASRDGARPAHGRAPIRLCHITRNDCSDFDFPRLLEADAHVSALLRTLRETATLLRRLARAERGGGHLPS